MGHQEDFLCLGLYIRGIHIYFTVSLFTPLYCLKHMLGWQVSYYNKILDFFEDFYGLSYSFFEGFESKSWLCRRFSYRFSPSKPSEVGLGPKVSLIYFWVQTFYWSQANNFSKAFHISFTLPTETSLLLSDFCQPFPCYTVATDPFDRFRSSAFLIFTLTLCFHSPALSILWSGSSVVLPLLLAVE